MIGDGSHGISLGVCLALAGVILGASGGEWGVGERLVVIGARNILCGI